MTELITVKNSPAYAFKCLLQGLKMLTKPGVRRFLIIPLLVNFLLYSTALGLGYYYVNDLITAFIPTWLDWLSWLIWPLFFLSFFTIGFFTFTLLANIFAAPFYSQLAAKVEWDLSGTKTTEQAIMATILSELKRILYLLLRALPLLILFVIPVVNIIAPLLWMLFAAWSIALEYMAYPLENKGLLFPEQRQTAKAMRLGTLCFGALVVIGLSIPLVNIIMPPVAVIAATIYYHGLKE